jgi:UDPglucose--hexose-1-phosphate uridylyltransferase
MTSDNPSTTRTTARLADGRRLYYFDSTPDSGRGDYLDLRELPPQPPAAQLRYDALRQEWIAVASARQTRPMLPATIECPLCPSTPGRSTEIPAPDYEVAVFENRFPSFGGTPITASGDDDGDVLSPRRPAVGACEVVCFTSDHDASFAQLSAARARLVLDALADRTAELSAKDGVAQVFCFENRGEEIGVTLHHPHGQIYAYPYVTPVTVRQLAAAKQHRQRTGTDLFAQLLAAEQAGPRVVARNADWTAFVPAAARWPYEVHIYPHERFADLAALPSSYRDSFAPLYLAVLRAFDGLFDVAMPYVSGWHQAPVHVDRELGYLHLELFSVRRAPGKLKYLAGSESAMGAFVNDVSPEAAAEMIRGRM